MMRSSISNTKFRYAHESSYDDDSGLGVEIGFLYPDELQMLGIASHESRFFADMGEEKCGKVHPLEQISMISDEDKKWGTTHAARVLLEFSSITYPKKVTSIPKERTLI